MPCCFYDLSGKKVDFGKIKLTDDGDQTATATTRYAQYIAYIESICHKCGYVTERENLRIPSTKNVAIIGRKRSFLKSDVSASKSVDAAIEALLETVKCLPRISDKEKQILKAMEKASKSTFKKV